MFFFSNFYITFQNQHPNKLLRLTFIKKQSHNNNKISQDSRLLQFFGFSPYNHICEFLLTSYFITNINKKLSKQNKRPLHTRPTV